MDLNGNVGCRHVLIIRFTNQQNVASKVTNQSRRKAP